MKNFVLRDVHMKRLRGEDPTLRLNPILGALLLVAWMFWESWVGPHKVKGSFFCFLACESVFDNLFLATPSAMDLEILTASPKANTAIFAPKFLLENLLVIRTTRQTF
jgi:hypothetical protein